MTIANLPLQNTGRVTYAQNLDDGTLDRSFNYDHVGRLQSSFTGTSARAHVGLGSTWLADGPYAAHENVYDVWGNITSRTGWGGANPQYTAGYTNNKQTGWAYDAAGNLTDAGGGWTFSYDATGQQAGSAVGSMQNSYDGDRLRGKKTEYGVTTYYVRSSVLGGQVVAEVAANGDWARGYVYIGGELLAVQHAGVYWVHQDPFVKSKRVTDSAGNVVSVVELDPSGGETNPSSNESFQPRRFTTYERDAIMSDEAMHRRYNRWWGRFEHPDPYDGSYNLTDPQSFNRYTYVQNDPVNFVDPLGLDPGGALGGALGGLLGGTPHIGTVGTVTINDGDFELEDTIPNLEPGAGGELIPGGPNPGPEREPPVSTANQEPNCLTINKLLKNQGVKNAFESAWRASVRSGGENGGWIFADGHYGSDVQIHTASEGTPTAMDKEPDEFRTLVRTLQQGGRPARFILDYHTHPNGDPNPGADIWVRPLPFKRGSIGVIISGPGQYTFYDARRVIPQSDYNNCL